MSIPLLTIAAVMALAFANGANDVSKGIATLAGSGRATYRQALAWGAVWTAAGAFAALVISIGLINLFTSSLVAGEVLALSSFPLAVAAGASLWVLFASVTGLPVSTTHALTGAIVGVALSTGGIEAIRWGLLLSGIAVPLALSPLVSGILGYSMHGVARRIESACVCAEDQVTVPAVNSDGTLAVRSVSTIVTSAVACDPAPGRVRLMAGHVTHWGAAAAISFARAVNDNSKIAALGTLAFASMGSGGVAGAFALTALAMTVGSFAAGLRVSRTLGDRVVHMHTDTGLAGALVASGLVMAASFYTLPVSTTHVSTGAIVGAGMRQGSRAVQWGTVGSLVTAWVVTLPVCALLGGAAAWFLRAA
jgi:PiT family inorganic phosphate transporter